MKSIAKIFESAEFAIAPDTLLTRDGPINDSVMHVINGKISFVGNLDKFCASNPDLVIHRLKNCAVIPGFIDAHTHLGQAFGKAITGGEPAQIWRRIWVPMEAGFDEHAVYVSSKWMFLEALRGGFTGIVNFSTMDTNKTSAIHRAANDVGIRLVSSTGSALLIEDSGSIDPGQVNKAIDVGLSRAEAHIKACSMERLISPSICVPAIQAGPADLIQKLSEFCQSNGILFQIHTNEHHVEVHWCVTEYGMRPLEFFAKYGAVGSHTLHHHCTLVTDYEVELLRETGSGVTYNPLASAWKGDKVAPALAFHSRGVRFGIGTDSTRSDAFRLLEVAETAQRFSQGMQLADFSCGAAWTWLNAASRGSAGVSGLGDTTGELSPGLQADFLILDMSRPEVLPSWDFEWELVRLYNRDQITGVVVDGRLVMEFGQPIGWSADEFIETEEHHARRAVEVAPIIRRHGPAFAIKNRKL